MGYYMIIEDMNKGERVKALFKFKEFLEFNGERVFNDDFSRRLVVVRRRYYEYNTSITFDENGFSGYSCNVKKNSTMTEYKEFVPLFDDTPKEIVDTVILKCYGGCL